MKEQRWFQTNLGYSSTKAQLRNSGMAFGGFEDAGRFTFYLKDFRDVTIQITSRGKLSITYPEDVSYKPVLEKLKHFLVRADGTQAEVTGMIERRRRTQKAYPPPRIHFEITQQIGIQPHATRRLPNVGFNIANLNEYPIRTRIEARTILGGRDLGLVPDRKGYYTGQTLWNLNPNEVIFGNFNIPGKCVDSSEELTMEIRPTVIDQEGSEYEVLPRGWTYMRSRNGWFVEPRSFTE